MSEVQMNGSRLRILSLQCARVHVRKLMQSYCNSLGHAQLIFLGGLLFYFIIFLEGNGGRVDLGYRGSGGGLGRVKGGETVARL